MSYCENHMENIQRLTTLEAEVDAVNDRVVKLEKDNAILHEMNTNIGIMASQFKTQNNKLDGIEKDVKELKEKPAKKWDGMTSTIIASIIGLVIGFLFQEVIK